MKILIAGPPKSGTTGLFYRIRRALGSTPVREMFEPGSYKPRPGDGGQVVLAKILIGGPYQIDEASFEPFEKRIGLVRDPRDWVVSSLLYGIFHGNLSDDAKAAGEVIAFLRRKEADPSSVGVLEMIDLFRRLWSPAAAVVPGETEESFQFIPLKGTIAGHYQGHMRRLPEFFRRHPEYFVLKYEDFVSGALDGLQNYLGFSLEDPADVDPHVQRVVRTKGAGDWRNWFLERDVEFFRPLFTGFMEEFGYPPDWSLPDSRVIAAEHASAYVCNLLAERRAITLVHNPARASKFISRARAALKALQSRLLPGAQSDVAELELEIGELQIAVNCLAHQLRRAEHLSLELTTARARITELRDKLDTAKSRLEETKAILRQFRDQRQSILRFVSWRITTPLRSGTRWTAAGTVHIRDRKAPESMRLTIFRRLAWIFAAFVIIGTIAAISHSHRGHMMEQTRISSSRAQLGGITIALWQYRNVFGQYPSGGNAEIAKALLGANPKGMVFIESPLIKATSHGELLDPWGTPLYIRASSQDFEIISAGPSRVFGDSDDEGIRY
jgi:hypothetical protein